MAAILRMCSPCWRRVISGIVAAVLVVAMCLATGGRGQASTQGQNQPPEIERDLNALDVLRAAGDLGALDATIVRESVKWMQRDYREYLTYMFKACSVLSSYRIGDARMQAAMLNRYVMVVVAGGRMSVRQQLEFVDFLAADPEGLDAEAWRTLRRQKAHLWLEAWRRAADAIDPRFDASDVPLLNVPPPRESGLPAGIAPEAITDPRLRNQYERAIADNQAKAERYNEQYWLAKNARAFFARAERYLVTAYLKPPRDVPELRQLLMQYLDRDAAAARILAAVQ